MYVSPCPRVSPGEAVLGLSRGPPPPQHRSPPQPARPAAYCWLVLLSAAFPRTLSEGWQSSAPSQVIPAWTQASSFFHRPVLRERWDVAPALHLCSRAARLGSTGMPAQYGLLGSLCPHPLRVFRRQQQCWKKVLGYNHGNRKPPQSCLCLHGNGLSSPCVSASVLWF